MQSKVISLIAVGVLVGLLVDTASADLCELRVGGANTVRVTNLSTGDPPTEIEIDHSPGGVALSPDGRRAYVRSAWDTLNRVVSAIDIATLHVVDRIDLAPLDAASWWPGKLTVGSDGTIYATVSDNMGSRVVALDPTSHAATASITLSDIYSYPRRLAVGAGGTRLYVESITPPDQLAVLVVDLPTARVIASQVVPAPEWRVSNLIASPTGDFAYLVEGSDFDSGGPSHLWVIRADSVPQRLDMGPEIDSVAFSADGSLAYVYSGGVAPIDPTAVIAAASQTAVGSLPGGRVVGVTHSGCVLIAGTRSVRRACPGDEQSAPVDTDQLSPDTLTLAIGDSVSVVTWTDGSCQAPPLGCAPSSVCLSVQGGSAAPGETVQLDVRLQGNGSPVVGVQNDLFLDSALPIPLAASEVGGALRPRCRVNPDINKEQTVFSCQESDPLGCLSTRALVLSFYSVDPIADGTLYTCEVPIPAGAAPGRYRVACADAGASDPNGGAISSRCQEGEIVVRDNSGSAAVEGAGAAGSSSGCQVSPTGPAGRLGAAPLLLLALRAVAARRRRVHRTP